MEIFKLVGSIMVDAADAQNSISKTGKEADKLGQKLAKGVKTAAAWAAGVGAAVLAVGTAVVSAAQKTAAALDEVDKGSKRMNITAESYQELAHAADLCGVSMSTMEKAAKKLEGTDMSVDDALSSIMSLGTETERTQAAVDLFGESIAYQLEPLLQEGGDSFEQMKQEAHDLGLVMGEDAVANGAKMNDAFTKIKSTVSALGTSFMVDLMPYIQDILDWVMENMPVILDTVHGVLDAIMPIIQPILEAAFLFIQGIFALINGDTNTFVEDFKQAFINVANAMLGIGSDIINGLWNGMKSVWGNITAWVSEKVEWIKNMFRSAKDSADAPRNSAAGLPFVPYDNFSANLHYGEAVLTRQEAEAWRQSGSGAGNGGITIVQNISATPTTPVQLASATAAYFEQARWTI